MYKKKVWDKVLITQDTHAHNLSEYDIPQNLPVETTEWKRNPCDIEDSQLIQIRWKGER